MPCLIRVCPPLSRVLSILFLISRPVRALRLLKSFKKCFQNLFLIRVFPLDPCPLALKTFKNAFKIFSLSESFSLGQCPPAFKILFPYPSLTSLDPGLFPLISRPRRFPLLLIPVHPFPIRVIPPLVIRVFLSRLISRSVFPVAFHSIPSLADPSLPSHNPSLSVPFDLSPPFP